VWLLLIGIGGFLFGVGVLLIGSAKTTTSETFVGTSGFKVWAVLIGAQTAYWAVIAGPLWADLVDVWRQSPLGRNETLVLGAALIVIVIVFPLISVGHRVAWPLWGQSSKIQALTIIGGLAVGVPALSGIAMVQQQISARGARPVSASDIPAAVEGRRMITKFLSIAGAVIGLAVLASGALRKATVPQAFIRDTDFPQEYVLLYGAFFTGLLLLVYVPAHLSLRTLGLKIRDHFFPVDQMPEPDDDRFKAWVDKRGVLETFLQLNVSPSQQLQASLFILAPLISAVITSLVPRPT
jgi:hypothetical protein